MTVALSGDGGDELFSGYTRYAIGDRLWRVLSKVPPGARRGAAAFAAARAGQAMGRGPRRALCACCRERTRPRLVGDKLHKAAGVIGLGSADAIYQALISLWADPAAVVIGAGEPRRRSSDAPRSSPTRCGA